MNMDWTREDKDVPFFSITGQTGNEHGKIKAFHPPTGVKIKAFMRKTDSGMDELCITWGHKPTAEEKLDVNPNKLSAAQLAVFAAQNDVNPDGKSAPQVLQELSGSPVAPTQAIPHIDEQVSEYSD
jgi:hypothetical protein